MLEFTYYILIGKRVFKADRKGFRKWMLKHHGPTKTIAFARVSPTVEVSTIFMCIDHNHFGEGKPIVFETLVFGGMFDGRMERYATYNNALDGHAAMVLLARKGINEECKN